MNKPGRAVFETFRGRFEFLQQGKKKRQYLLPYFMSGHPGCTIGDMIDLAVYIQANHLYTEQVQDFTPTPMTLSTLMYYTGIDPYTGKKVYVARNIDAKRKQKEHFFWYKKPSGTHDFKGKSRRLKN